MSKKLILDPILDCLAQIWTPKFFCGFYIRHCSKLSSMKLQGKVMNQIWENGWNPSFGPGSDPKYFYCGYYFYYMLGIVASYHYMQFQGKLMNQIWENDKNSSFGTDFCPFCPNLGRQLPPKSNKTGLNISLLWKMLLEWDRYILPASWDRYILPTSVR